MNQAKFFCPCGTGHLYQQCCEKYHKGTLPENALKLMRSRYSAYALHLADYIIATTHSTHSNYEKDKKKWKENILNFSENTVFKKLTIVEFIDGKEEAYVTFIAHLEQGGKEATFSEKSRFLRQGNRWLYAEGKIMR